MPTQPLGRHAILDMGMRSPFPPIQTGKPPLRQDLVVSYDAITVTVTVTQPSRWSGYIQHLQTSLTSIRGKGCPKQAICLFRGTATEICRASPAVLNCAAHLLLQFDDRQSLCSEVPMQCQIRSLHMCVYRTLAASPQTWDFATRGAWVRRAKPRATIPIFINHSCSRVETDLLPTYPWHLDAQLLSRWESRGIAELPSHKKAAALATWLS